MKISPIKAVFTLLLLVGFAQPIFAEGAVDSTSVKVHPSTAVTRMKYQSYVDTNNCKELTSSPYVIVLGNGGTNMELQCPADRPVLKQWNFQVGFGGLGAVSSGGGNSRAMCCAVAHKWSA